MQRRTFARGGSRSGRLRRSKSLIVATCPLPQPLPPPHSRTETNDPKGCDVIALDSTFTRNAPAAAASRTAALAPSTWNDGERTVSAVLATETPVRREDGSGPFHEVLSMAGVRLERLNAGAAVLDSHNATSVASVVGHVIPGSARVEGGQLVADLSIASDAVAALIAAGSLRHVRLATASMRRLKVKAPMARGS